MNIKLILATAISVLSISAHAATNQQFVDESTAELEMYVGANATNYSMVCNVSPDGETAACTGKAVINGVNVSESFFCFVQHYPGAYATDISCNIRIHDPEGSPSRYSF